MRYHLFLNSIRKMVKTTKAFSRKLAVPRYMSTVVGDQKSQNFVYVNFECPLTVKRDEFQTYTYVAFSAIK